MKIAWFTPLPNEMTEIGNYSRRVLQVLKEHCEVVIYNNSQHNRKQQSKPLSDLGGIPILPFSVDNPDWVEFNQFDYCFYNIGNNVEFHSDIWLLSQKKPGIVILHDKALQHMFAGLFKNIHNDFQLYMDVMYSEYGTKGMEFVNQYWNGTRTIDELSAQYPLTELALRDQLAAVVHTNSLFEIIKDKDELPVLCTNLPHTAMVDKPREYSDKALPYQLIVFGYLGPNRGLESIIEALSQIPNREQYQLHLAGKLWDEPFIMNEVRKKGLQNQVKFHGYLSDEKLDQVLSCSDLAFNLRNPTMGEASASQLRIWEHSIPSFVSNHGWYAELPSDTVFFIDPKQEVENIKHHLIDYPNKKRLYLEKGNNGYGHLLKNYTSEKYVEDILRLAKKLSGSKGMYSLNKLFSTAISNNLDSIDVSMDLIVRTTQNQLLK